MEGRNSIKGSPYGTLFQCFTRAAVRVQRNLRDIVPRSECVASGGGDLQGSLQSLLIMHRFSAVRGPQARCDAVLYLSVCPLLYRCSIRSLAWLCVLSLYLVATR